MTLTIVCLFVYFLCALCWNRPSCCPLFFFFVLLHQCVKNPREAASGRSSVVWGVNGDTGRNPADVTQQRCSLRLLSKTCRHLGMGSLTVALERDWFVLMCSAHVLIFVTTVIKSLLSLYPFIDPGAISSASRAVIRKLNGSVWLAKIVMPLSSYVDGTLLRHSPDWFQNAVQVLNVVSVEAYGWNDCFG